MCQTCTCVSNVSLCLLTLDSYSRWSHQCVQNPSENPSVGLIHHSTLPVHHLQPRVWIQRRMTCQRCILSRWVHIYNRPSFRLNNLNTFYGAPDKSAMAGHRHDAMQTNQNLGNTLGSRSAVRQTHFFRKYESGNTMKALLGTPNLSWDVTRKLGVILAMLFQAVLNRAKEIGGI